MAGHRLLIVEDDSATRQRLRTLFEGKGWDVREAGTVGEALSALNTQPEPCCLILDLVLPDGDGSVVLEKVRAKRLKTRVAVCTGIDDLARLRGVAGLLPDAILAKPITLPAGWVDSCPICEAERTEPGRGLNAPASDSNPRAAG